MRRRNLIGQQFGRWTVISTAEPVVYKSGHTATVWHCKCACGTEADVLSSNLTSNHSRSCGCLRDELCSIAKTKHGSSRKGKRTVEYRLWGCMISRCTDPNNRSYQWYGARGITVCERWRNSFAAFLEDMGPKPSRKHSLDRRNNDGNYEPGNCRWATASEQVNNRRMTIYHAYQGQMLTARAIWDSSPVKAVSYDTFRCRLYHEWDIPTALQSPVKSSRWGKAA